MMQSLLHHDSELKKMAAIANTRIPKRLHTRIEKRLFVVFD